ncbi:hypothetical protein P280DRAFT_517590 [Massarina eburnea CBS 473.64]|uniref:MYND-type domain-containing protein n=1 Tax=Massarina eburnea CBS 473.64 TaxID=1395130 RepID=A0A6A6S0M4_9PLEO|nr:hypothetical protein P280DRAFT_517590 [Massarina eburnea CBS 473.64]
MATDLATKMVPFLNPPLCANSERVVNGELSPCTKSTTQTCNHCHLVQYCSKNCRNADWKHHKKICDGDLMKKDWMPRYVHEGRTPAYVGGPLHTPFGVPQYLWGNVPAIDILNLKDNEKDQGVDFKLLFAASGDLRNVIKTIVGLPKDYKGKCTLVINDANFHVASRNILLLLIALSFEPEVAAPIMIHLWYSALLPKSMLFALQHAILPILFEINVGLSFMPMDGHQYVRTFRSGDKYTMIVHLDKAGWIALKDMLMVPFGLTEDLAQSIRKRTMLAPERADYFDRAMYRQPPAARPKQRSRYSALC